jgi:lipoprotein-releasing system ATP-binding protein
MDYHSSRSFCKYIELLSNYPSFCYFCAMLKANGIVKSFGNLKVLGGLDFYAQEREVISIVGRSGAGKTTFLQILGTLMRPDSGSVTIDGTNIISLSPRDLSKLRNTKIGFVFQFHYLLPEFTALENVMMPALIGEMSGYCKCSGRHIKERALELLADMGLSDRVEHKPSELSGGEQQRVAIARALINGPSVVFADEPSGNLDTQNKIEIHDLFFHLREKYGQTIIIVTHDRDLAEMSYRILEMRDGLFI